MATYSVFGSGTATTTGATWTNTTNSTGTNDGAVATFTASTGTGQITLPFAAGSISGTVISASATIWGAVATVNRWTGGTAQLLDSSGAAISSTTAVTYTTSNAAHTVSFNVMPTVSQVNAGLKVQFSLSRTGASSSTWTVDAAQISIGYATSVSLPYTEPFTGTNGADWPGGWVPLAGGGGTTGGCTIQSNAGQIAAGSAVAYSGEWGFLGGMPSSTTDVEVVATVLVSAASAEAYTGIGISSDSTPTTGTDPTNGYVFKLCYPTGTQGFQLSRVIGASGTALVAPTSTVTHGIRYGLRVQRIGNRFRGRYWDSTTTEPSTWDIDFTDTGATVTTGQIYLFTQNGNANFNVTGSWDDVTVQVPSSGSTANASLSGVGALSAGIVPAVATTAALSGAGALSVVVISNLAAGAGLSGSGSLSAQLLAAFSRTAALSGVGTLTSTSGFAANAGLSGSGSLGTVGVPAIAASAALSGVGALTETAAPALPAAASLAGAGSLSAALAPATATTAALSGSGTLTAAATNTRTFQSWDGGTGAADTVTVSATNTNGPGNLPIASAFSSGSGSTTFSSTQAHSGTLSLKVDQPSGASDYAVFNVSGVLGQRFVTRFYVYAATLSFGANSPFAIVYNTGGVQIAGVYALTTGNFGFGPSGNTDTGVAISLNTWYRIELGLTVNSSGAGFKDLTIYSGANLETTTADYSSGSVAATLSTTVPATMKVGNGTATVTFARTIYYDDWAFDSNLPSGYIGTSLSGPQASAGLSGVGALSVGTVLAALAASAALAGVGTLTASQVASIQIAAALSGVGALTVVATPAVSVAVGLSGSGSLSASGSPILSTLAALGGTGTLSTNSGTAAPAGLSGVGSLAVTRVPALAAPAALAGAGALSVAATPALAVAAVLSGLGTLTAAASPRATIIAGLTGTGSLTATVLPKSVAAAGFTGSGVLAVAPSMQASPAFSGLGVLSVLVFAALLSRDIDVVVAGFTGSPGVFALLGNPTITLLPSLHSMKAAFDATS